MCKLVSLSDDNNIAVADIKRDCILNIINSAKCCSEIDKIVLFGSALEGRCREDSDIDIAIVGNLSAGEFNTSKGYLDFRARVFSYKFEQDYDMLYFKGEEGSIASRGVVIYSRELWRCYNEIGKR